MNLPSEAEAVKYGWRCRLCSAPRTYGTVPVFEGHVLLYHFPKTWSRLGDRNW